MHHWGRHERDPEAGDRQAVAERLGEPHELTEKIEAAFSVRQKPAQVGLDDGVWQLDSEVEEALWFSGRDWHEVTWEDWQEHSSAIYFFDPDAFAYYLPSLLTLSAENPDKWLQAMDSLIMELDRTPEVEVGTRV